MRTALKSLMPALLACFTLLPPLVAAEPASVPGDASVASPKAAAGAGGQGWVDLRLQDLSPDLAVQFGLAKDAQGALVADVLEGAPAKDAGILSGDVIRSLNGRPVDSTEELKRGISAEVGERVTLGVWRDGQAREFTLTVSTRDAKGASARPSAPRESLGVEVRAATATDSSPAGTGQGLVVTKVEAGSPAAVAGIQVGDLLLECAHKKLRDPQDLAGLSAGLKAGDSVLTRVLRDGKSAYLTLKLPVEPLPSRSPDGRVFSLINEEYSEGWEKGVGPVSYVSGFTHDGVRLDNRGLEDVIDPLGDAQASRLLHSGEADQAWGVGLACLGMGMVVGSVVDILYEVGHPTFSTDAYGDTTQDFPNLVPFFALLFGGIGGGVGGLLLAGHGANDRQAGVERYNQVVNGLKSLSLLDIPNTRTQGLACTLRF